MTKFYTFLILLTAIPFISERDTGNWLGHEWWIAHHLVGCQKWDPFSFLCLAKFIYKSFSREFYLLFLRNLHCFRHWASRSHSKRLGLADTSYDDNITHKEWWLLSTQRMLQQQYQQFHHPIFCFQTLLYVCRCFYL